MGLPWVSLSREEQCPKEAIASLCQKTGYYKFCGYKEGATADLLEVEEKEAQGLLFPQETFEILDPELALWNGVFEREEKAEQNEVLERIGAGLRTSFVTQLASRIENRKGEKKKAKPSFRVFFEGGTGDRQSIEDLWYLSGLLAEALSRAPREIL